MIFMRKILLLVFMFTLSALKGLGQLPTVVYRNQLYRSLNTTRIDSARLPLLHKIGAYYLDKYRTTQQRVFIDSAIKVFKRSVSLSEAIHLDDGNGKYECLRQLGSAYVMARDTAAGRYYTMQYISYYEKRHQPKKVSAAWIKYGFGCVRAGFINLAQQCYIHALAIAQKNKFFDDEAIARYYIAFTTTNRDEAERICLAAIKEFNNRKINLDKFYYLLAHFYRYKGDMKSSLSYGLASMNAMEFYKDTLSASNIYGEIALIYDLLGQPEKSITYYKKTLAIREKMAIPVEFILRTVGFVIKDLIKIGKFKEALSEANAYEARHPPQNPDDDAMISQNKAYCYEAMKDYQNAEKYYLKMMNDYDHSGSTDEVIALARYDIGRFYAATNRYQKAQIYTRRLSNKLLTFYAKKDVELLRFKVDSGLGNYRQAVEDYIRYQKLKDSISGESTKKKIAELQIKYETDQKEKDIELLKKDSQIQRDRTKQANFLRNLTFAGVGLLLILLMVLYSSYRSNQKKSREIDLKNESLNQLLTDKDQLLEEKDWLIKEVHHRVKNNLQIVMSLLQRQSSFVNNKEALSAIRNSEHRMHSIALIHQKLYQSDSLMLVNMVDYINEMIGYLQECFDLGTRIRFEKLVADIFFEVNIAVPVGLILNEAITNSIKYAFNGHHDCCIRIGLRQSGEHNYLLEIADNGRGLAGDIDPEKMNSMGFNLMRGLSRQLGGKLSVSNDNGLTIKIAFQAR